MTRVASIRVWKPFEVTGEGPRGYKSNLYPRRILGVSFRTAVSKTLAYNEEQFFFIFFSQARLVRCRERLFHLVRCHLRETGSQQRAAMERWLGCVPGFRQYSRSGFLLPTALILALGKERKTSIARALTLRRSGTVGQKAPLLLRVTMNSLDTGSICVSGLSPAEAQTLPTALL